MCLTPSLAPQGPLDKACFTSAQAPPQTTGAVCGFPAPTAALLTWVTSLPRIPSFNSWLSQNSTQALPPPGSLPRLPSYTPGWDMHHPLAGLPWKFGTSSSVLPLSVCLAGSALQALEGRVRFCLPVTPVQSSSSGSMFTCYLGPNQTQALTRKLAQPPRPGPVRLLLMTL